MKNKLKNKNKLKKFLNFKFEQNIKKLLLINSL